MSETRIKKILRIDSSSSRGRSLVRRLGDAVIRRSRQGHRDAGLINRDPACGIGFPGQHRVQANLTNPARRSPAQNGVLAGPDPLAREQEIADEIVITAPDMLAERLPACTSTAAA
jgi:FMN-dependent NADH-azoreductase